MNYHFTTAKAHITRLGGRVEELVKAEGLESASTLPFKGNIDLDALERCIQRETPANVPFVRLEAGTNLIGGQPISYENMKGRHRHLPAATASSPCWTPPCCRTICTSSRPARQRWRISPSVRSPA